MSRALAAARRAVDVREGELGALLLAFGWFFCLLCGYYLLRPLREEMGIRGGVEALHWVFTATFGAMVVAVPIYSAVVARLARSRLVPAIYRFFVLNLLAFHVLLRLEAAPAWTARAFFVWISVYNLFVVSIFWSFLADVFDAAQGRRLFGFIAAGGSAGALAGPALAALLVKPLGIASLVLIAAALLEVCARLAGRLARAAPPPGDASRARLAERVGGGPFAGFALVLRSRYLLALAAQMLFVTVTSTFVYFQQARVVAATLRDPEARTQLFAAIDLAVNLLALALQSFATGPLLSTAGVGAALALHPLLAGAGLAAIAVAPGVWVVAAVQVLRRAVHYAIERPAREVLFTVVGGEEKYKAKGFIDTVVYRGGDAAAAWVQAGLAGFGLAASALLAAPLAALWLATVLWLARRERALERA